jgi:hypothetical protein
VAQKRAPKRFSFILRLWDEATPRQADGSPELRGSLRSVHTDEVFYFNSLDEIPQIVRAITGWESESEPAQLTETEADKPADLDDGGITK